MHAFGHKTCCLQASRRGNQLHPRVQNACPKPSHRADARWLNPHLIPVPEGHIVVVVLRTLDNVARITPPICKLRLVVSIRHRSHQMVRRWTCLSMCLDGVYRDTRIECTSRRNTISPTPARFKQAGVGTYAILECNAWSKKGHRTCFQVSPQSCDTARPMVTVQQVG
jgi:hypothetical protein